MTSLLRKHDREQNVWETMLEYVESQPLGRSEIPKGIDGTRWFCSWCANEFNREKLRSEDLVKDMIGYGVRVCRPSYPRNPSDANEDFVSVDILEGFDAALRSPGSDTSGRKIKMVEIEQRLHTLKLGAEGTGPYRWLAILILS